MFCYCSGIMPDLKGIKSDSCKLASFLSQTPKVLKNFGVLSLGETCHVLLCFGRSIRAMATHPCQHAFRMLAPLRVNYVGCVGAQASGNFHYQQFCLFFPMLRPIIWSRFCCLSSNKVFCAKYRPLEQHCIAMGLTIYLPFGIIPA